MRVVRKDGSQFWVRIEATVALDSEGQVVYRTSVSDVSEHKRMEEALHALLLIDELTGLYNRRGFLTLSQQQLKMANRTKNKMLLFYADFDHLKQINDALGHPEGDRALIEAANVLKETFRASDIIARIGGDEFAVLVIDTDRTEAEILTNRLHENLKARNDERNRRFKLLLSIGIARYDPEFPCSIDELIATADKMMYERKQDDQRS